MVAEIEDFYRSSSSFGISEIFKSPVDGAVTYVGPVQGYHLHQVKGVKYDLRQFIGPLETIDSEVVIDIDQYWSLLSLN